MDRSILHCDMNNFYASVELLSHPELAGKPVAVSGNPENRHGIILAKNGIAKSFGVVTAETVWQARQKCPGLVLLPPHHQRYAHYSKLINEIYRQYTDMVEPFSIDESFLDVTASQRLFGSGQEIADRIRQQVRQEYGLTLSAGVSFNKLFAKMGSDYKKPDATTVITRENYRDILWPLPVREMFSVGAATADKLVMMGLRTIGDLARADRRQLTAALGKHGSQLSDYANGLEDSPVALFEEKRKMKSVGNGITFRRDLLGEKDIRTAVVALSDNVASRLRHYQMKCGGVKVDIKDPGFRTISRQKLLDSPSNLAEEIGRAAMELILAHWPMTSPIRLLTITGINLRDEDAAEQLSFFQQTGEARERAEKIERAMDSIRGKYGSGAVTFGSLLSNDLGIEIRQEED